MISLNIFLFLFACFLYEIISFTSFSSYGLMFYERKRDEKKTKREDGKKDRKEGWRKEVAY